MTLRVTERVPPRLERNHSSDIACPNRGTTGRPLQLSLSPQFHAGCSPDRRYLARPCATVEQVPSHVAGFQQTDLGLHVCRREYHQFGRRTPNCCRSPRNCTPTRWRVHTKESPP